MDQILQPVTDLIIQTFLVDETTALVILVSSLLVLLTTLFWIVRRRSGGKGRAILLTGLCDAGKTQMFTELIGAHGASTLTSMKENEVEVSIGSKSWNLVDVPGYHKIRGSIIDKFKNECRGLVFVIDSARFTREAKDVAEFLYEILTEPTLNRSRILVACNKQDNGLAKSSKLIKSLLEKEFTLLNTSRAAALDSTEGETTKRLLGKGPDGGSFSFGDLRRKVEFVECTAAVTNGHKKADLGVIQGWCDGL